MQRLALVLVCAVSTAVSGAAAAGELEPRRTLPRPVLPRTILPRDAAVVIELHRPARVFDHPLVRDGWREVSRSRELQRRLDAPESDRLRQLQAFLAQLADDPAAGDWKSGLDRLTRGGAAVSVSGSPGAPEIVLTAVAADEASLKRFLEVFEAAVLRQIPEDRRPAALPRRDYGGVEVVLLGEARLAIAGNVLFAANRESALNGAIDRWNASKNHANSQVPVDTQPEESRRLLSVDVDLEQLRDLPQVAKGLAIPSDDIGRVFVLGGWIDLLRRAGRLRADVTLEESALSVSLKLSAGRDGVTPGLEGYFAPGSPAEGGRAGAAPLLRVPGMIFSASTYRDYSALWKGREKTLDAAALKRFNDGEEQARRQLELFGGRFAPGDFVADLGTHFRVVVAPQLESAYGVDQPEKLPAAAFVVDWRNDAFQDKLQPILRFFGIIAGADQNQATTVVEKHAGAELTSIRFPEDAAAVRKGNRIRYQFSPTYTFTRGHFIAGSTTEIVRQVIDALDAERALDTESAREATMDNDVTESQWFSGVAAADALGSFRSALINGSMLEDGLTLSEAEHELEVAQSALRALGEMTSTTVFGRNEFEIRLRVGR